MIPPFNPSGNLPQGIHRATWKQLVAALGFTPRRRQLLRGLRQALRLLRSAGCRLVYVDGSFVTAKPDPGDFDGCWSIAGVDVERLDPIFLDFSNSRARQKEAFLGELFPAELPEGATGKTFLDFFQTDRETGKPKGILALDLRRWRQ